MKHFFTARDVVPYGGVCETHQLLLGTVLLLLNLRLCRGVLAAASRGCLQGREDRVPRRERASQTGISDFSYFFLGKYIKNN